MTKRHISRKRNRVVKLAVLHLILSVLIFGEIFGADIRLGVRRCVFGVDDCFSALNRIESLILKLNSLAN